jgi:hypothetical protein
MKRKFKVGDIVRFTGDHGRRNDYIADSEADLLDDCRTHKDCGIIYECLDRKHQWIVKEVEEQTSGFVPGLKDIFYHIVPAGRPMKKPLFVEQDDLELCDTPSPSTTTAP